MEAANGETEFTFVTVIRRINTFIGQNCIFDALFNASCRLIEEGEDFVAVLSDEDGVFAVAADGTVFHFDGPVVAFVNVVGGLAEARHRLNTNGVTFDQLVAATFFAIIGDLRRFMNGLADTVADIVLDDTEVA